MQINYATTSDTSATGSNQKTNIKNKKVLNQMTVAYDMLFGNARSAKRKINDAITADIYATA